MTTLVMPHGLGDLIQSLPAVKAYAAINGPVSVAVMGRLPAFQEVFRGLPHIADIITTPDPWNDYKPRDTMAGFRHGCFDICLKLRAQGRDPFLLPTARPAYPLSRVMNKGMRFHRDLGTTWDGSAPDLSHLNQDDAREGRAAVERLRDVVPGVWRQKRYRVAVIHGVTGNAAKDVTGGYLMQVAQCALSGFTNFLTVTANPSKSLAWWYGAMQAADMFVGADSGPAHLASCTETRVRWVFTKTPMEQALPLWRPVEAEAVGANRFELMSSYAAWESANECPKHRVYDGGGV